MIVLDVTRRYILDYNNFVDKNIYIFKLDGAG
jgi:hypothetical protein